MGNELLDRVRTLNNVWKSTVFAMHSETEMMHVVFMDVTGNLRMAEAKGFDDTRVFSGSADYAFEEDTYVHYKGGRYTTLGEAVSDHGDRYVLYRAESGRHWLRPFDMFHDSLVVDGELKKRFTKLN